MFLARRRLQRAIDQQQVHQAIVDAERRTSGEIRVSLSPFFWGDVHSAAERAFERMGMTGTRQRNGVLFFVVPSRRRFVVLGDQGIHSHVGQQFWHDVTAAVGDRFRRGDFTGGLVHGIETVGEELAEAFPAAERVGQDQLPDEIDVG
jgi:uncharacterized membrane protein